MCPEWLSSFENFFKDMGPRPGSHLKWSIERRNNLGNYTPSNCYWSTRSIQSRNTRRNVRLTYEGRTQVLQDWANELGIDRMVLKERLKRFNAGRISENKLFSPKAGALR